MPDIKIKELLRKYLEGRATPEEEKLVDDWYGSLSGNDDMLHLSDTERSILRNLYWNSLKAKIRQPGAQSRNLWPKFIGIAASVAAIVMVTLFLLPSEVRDSEYARMENPAGMNEIFNDSGIIREVVLPDSSAVMLFPGSKLQLSHGFNVVERKIHLSGQAFFDISHNADKPFYVFANEVVTKVLGTSFRVTAYPKEVNITVAVKSGKVSVYANPEKNPVLPNTEKIILTPNQQAVYSRSDRKVSRMLVKEPEVIITEEEVKKIRFEGKPVSEIFKVLEKMYGVEIVFEKEVFTNCSITTSVSGKDLYERVDVICEIIGAAYTVEETRILISGAGCN